MNQNTVTVSNVAGLVDAVTVGGEREAPRYQVFTAADALKPLPPIDWVIDGLIPAGTITVLFGDAGSKKTYAALDAAVCVALGMPWLDFQTTQGAALFVDEEMGGRYLSGRVSEAIRGHLANESTPLYYTSLAGFDLRQDEDTAELHRLVLKTAARLVVIDAMMDVIPGADENSVKDVAPVIKALKHIADKTQAAIILIHHANKAGGYRGSTAIKGGVDLMLEIESSQDSEILTFKTEKPRLIASKKFIARATWGDGEFYLATSEDAAEARQFLGKPQSYVIRYLAKSGPSVMANIQGNADTCAPTSAQRAVYSLVDVALVERVDDKGPGRKATFYLTDSGLACAQREGYQIATKKEPVTNFQITGLEEPTKKDL